MPPTTSRSWFSGLTDSVAFDKWMNLYVLGILVSVSEDLLIQKLREGRKGEGGYSRWSFGRNFPQKIIELSTVGLQPVNVISALSLYHNYYAKDDWMFPRYHFYVRLYFATSRKVVGYFKSYSSNQKHTEVRFQGDDWVIVPADEPKILNHSRRWRYFLHETS